VVDIDIYLDSVKRTTVHGPARVSALRLLLEVPPNRWIALHEHEFERFLAADEQLVVSAAVRLTTSCPLAYRPHSKHKREPARGRKGSLCPAGVDGPALLAQLSTA
jgi:hypothetical protein